MTADRRLATLTLCASVLLHLIIAVSGSLFPWRVEPPLSPQSTRYVVRLRQPTPTPPPTAVPVLPAPAPLVEPPPRPKPVAPRAAQPLAPAQPQAPPTPVPTVTATSVPSVQASERAMPRKPRAITPVPTAPAPPVSQVAAAPVRPVQPDAPAVPTPVSAPKQARQLPPQPLAPLGEDPIMAYLTRVVQALEREKRYPSVARRRAISGHVTLQFAILADGRVVDAKITQSSGHTVLNTATLQALRRASPMPPFPDAIQKRRLQVEVPIAYELTP